MVRFWLVLLVAGLCSGVERVCYYTNWSQYRPQPMTYFPEDIDATLCSYLVFAFANMVDGQLLPYEWNDLEMYGRFNRHKESDPTLKTLLAVGGYNHGIVEMTKMLASQETRANFIQNSITYLRENDFDGLGLDFQYPGSRGSPPEDKERFTLLCQEMRAAFEQEAEESGEARLLVTAAVGIVKSVVDAGYERGDVAEALDFINLLSYDMRGVWDGVTGHHCPLHARSDEVGDDATLNIEWAASYWVEGGAATNKINIGLAAHGRGFTLVDPDSNGYKAPISGPSGPGIFTREAGILAYYEWCNRNGTRVWDDEGKFPYAYEGSQWVGFEDQESYGAKLAWIEEEGYLGWMVWTLDLDDFNGSQCGEGSYPLLRSLN